MPKSLSSLWLKSVRRMGKAQQAQGRRLLQSLAPQPPRAPAVRKAPARVAQARPTAPVRKSVVLAAAQGVSCTVGGMTLQDQVSITGTSGDAFFAAQQ